jgi:hypothetical protein
LNPFGSRKNTASYKPRASSTPRTVSRRWSREQTRAARRPPLVRVPSVDPRAGRQQRSPSPRSGNCDEPKVGHLFEFQPGAPTLLWASSELAPGAGHEDTLDRSRTATAAQARRRGVQGWRGRSPARGRRALRPPPDLDRRRQGTTLSPLGR